MDPVAVARVLRASRRLWNAGNGTIVRPELDQILPQRPYMVLGTLRDQLLTPVGLKTSN